MLRLLFSPHLFCSLQFSSFYKLRNLISFSLVPPHSTVVPKREDLRGRAQHSTAQQSDATLQSSTEMLLFWNLPCTIFHNGRPRCIILLHGTDVSTALLLIAPLKTHLSRVRTHTPIICMMAWLYLVLLSWAYM